MAIGRVSGPMLLPNLERQGVDLRIDGNLLYFDVTNRSITVGSDKPLYTLPNVAPTGRSILYAEGSGSLKTFWGPAPINSSVSRQRYTVTIPSLPGYGNANVILNTGMSSIVYNVTVNRPGIKVEVFGTPAKIEPNPYTFISASGHLTDDGTVTLNDGSSFQSRNYSIFANMEEPPKSNMYATITSVSSVGAGSPVVLQFYYYTSIIS